jgi:hypothetical protein
MRRKETTTTLLHSASFENTQNQSKRASSWCYRNESIFSSNWHFVNSSWHQASEVSANWFLSVRLTFLSSLQFFNHQLVIWWDWLLKLAFWNFICVGGQLGGSKLVVNSFWTRSLLIFWGSYCAQAMLPASCLFLWEGYHKNTLVRGENERLYCKKYHKHQTENYYLLYLAWLYLAQSILSTNVSCSLL